jgi:lactoylglutathione lyase
VDVHARLLVDDPAEVARFYRDLLGLTTRFEAAGVYVELDADGTTLGLYRRELMAEVVGDELEPGDSVLIVVGVDDVAASVERLREQGVEVVVEPTERADWHLLTAHVRDPAGNLVEINAPLGGG